MVALVARCLSVVVVSAWLGASEFAYLDDIAWNSRLPGIRYWLVRVLRYCPKAPCARVEM